ncbi:MAG: LCP family protein [Lachnospiraceae bacterium]
MGKRKPIEKMTKRQRAQLRKKKMIKRISILVMEVIILTILGVVSYGVVKLDRLGHQTLDHQKLEVYKDTGPYTNIALFGLDSREGEIKKGVRSDTIMIASINNDTGTVKLLSVFRDTLLQQQDGTYEKANAAYSYGGPEEAIAMLNRNLDLDIKNYMSVNFNALVDVIDLLGGITIDLTDEERIWMNGYAAETAEVVGQENTDLMEFGKQKLTGVQAVSYARIRYTAGDDFKRAERQRIVLQKIVEKAQKAKLSTLNKIIDKVFPQVYTSLSPTDLIGVAANALHYKIGESTGFPFDVTTSEEIKKHNGSYVVPIGFADNVVQLHKYLFGEENYQPSEKVQEVNQDIIYLSDIDPANYVNGQESVSQDNSSYQNEEDSNTEEYDNTNEQENYE